MRRRRRLLSFQSFELLLVLMDGWVGGLVCYGVLPLPPFVSLCRRHRRLLLSHGFVNDAPQHDAAQEAERGGQGRPNEQIEQVIMIIILLKCLSERLIHNCELGLSMTIVLRKWWPRPLHFLTTICSIACIKIGPVRAGGHEPPSILAVVLWSTHSRVCSLYGESPELRPAAAACHVNCPKCHSLNSHCIVSAGLCTRTPR